MGKREVTFLSAAASFFTAAPSLPAQPPIPSVAMKTSLLLALALLAPVVRGVEPGFESLFNGKDLSGWEGLSPTWAVEDGAITGVNTAEAPLKHNTFLVWKGGEVANFELRARFRFMSPNPKDGNAGIQYRSKVVDAEKFIVAGYQGDFNAEGRYIGLFYEEKGRGILAQPGQQVIVKGVGNDKKPILEVIGSTTPHAEVLASIKPGEWVDYTIIAIGNHLRHYVNGRLSTELFDLDTANAASKGIVALQVHTGPPMKIQFKDLRLKKLP